MEEVEVNFFAEAVFTIYFLYKNVLIVCNEVLFCHIRNMHIITKPKKIANSDIVDLYQAAFEICNCKILQSWHLQSRSLTLVGLQM